MVFAKCINNVRTTVSASRSPGGDIVVHSASRIVLGSGEWVRVTLANRLDPKIFCIFRCDAVSGNVLSGLTAIEGTVDISASPGDTVTMRITAGALADVHAALLYTTASPTTAAVGGVPAGTSYTDQPLAAVVDAILHPYQSPAFTAFAIAGATTQEVGASFSGTKSFTWSTSASGNVAANSVSIVDTTNSTSLGTGLANSGSVSLAVGVTKNAPGANVWTIGALDTLGGSFSATASVQWMWRAYYGTSSSVTIDESQVKSLAGSLLTTAFARTYGLAGGGYKYLCFPDSFGDPSSFRDASTFLNVAMCDSTDDPSYSHTANGFSYATLAVTNSNGVTTSYRVYRTKNVLGGGIQVSVA